MINKRFISTTELAKILGISRVAVYKRIQAGKIKAEKVGHNFIIERKEVVDVLDKELTEKQKREIDKAIKKTIKEYGQTLKMLGTT